MVLSILLERPLVKQLDLADGPNFSDASRKSIGVEAPFRELPVKSCLLGHNGITSGLPVIRPELRSPEISRTRCSPSVGDLALIEIQMLC